MTSKSVFRRQVFVAFLAVIILFPVSVDHNFVTSIVGDRREIFIALVAPVKNSSVFVDGQLYRGFCLCKLVSGEERGMGDRGGD